jgi:hypothetical protein
MPQRHLIVSSLLATLIASPALAAGDKFNRDALGFKWTVTAGSLYITDNMLQGDTGSLGYLTKASEDGLSGHVKVYLNGTDLQYGAIAVGDVAGGNNAFVKIQSQDGGGMFDHGGFYTGNNNPVSFFTLDSPMASPARLKVTFSGTVATMTIKSPSGTQVYQFDYGATFGLGGGLGTYGPVSLDNYKARTAGTEDAAAPAPRVIHGSSAKDLSL